MAFDGKGWGEDAGEMARGWGGGGGINMMLARIFLLTCIHANIHTAAYCMHNMHSCILFCTTTLVKTHVEFFCACAQMYQPAGL